MNVVMDQVAAGVIWLTVTVLCQTKGSETVWTLDLAMSERVCAWEKGGVNTPCQNKPRLTTPPGWSSVEAQQSWEKLSKMAPLYSVHAIAGSSYRHSENIYIIDYCDMILWIFDTLPPLPLITLFVCARHPPTELHPHVQYMYISV